MFKAEIHKINPQEILLPIKSGSNKEYEDIVDGKLVSFVDENYWQTDNQDEKYKLGFMCANSILKYTQDAKKELTPQLNKILPYDVQHFLFLNKTTRNALELVQNMSDGKKYGSLFWALDETKTPIGRRLLEKYINEPICDIKEILNRQRAISEIIENKKVSEENCFII